MKGKQFVQEIKNLFYSYQLEECIKKSNEDADEYQDFTNYQTVQLFKGLSYFELSRSADGHQCIKKLIEDSKQKKGDKVQQVDLFIMTMYQWEKFDEDSYQAEEYNLEFSKLLDSYKQQSNFRDLQQDGVYTLAQGMNQFIDTFRSQNDLKCIETLKKAQQQEKQYNQEIYFLIGWMLEYKYNYQDSLESYLQLEKINPNYPGLLNNIGSSLKLLNHKEKAEKYYQKAYKLCPRNTIIINNIAVYFEELQNFQKSREYFQISYEINPLSPLTCKLYGRLLCKFDEFEEGKKFLNEAIRLKPNDCEIYQIQAGFDQEILLFNMNVEILKKCIEYKPKEGYYYYLIGDYYANQDNLELALEYLNKAVKLKLYSNILINAYARIGFCLFKLGRFEGALEQYLKSLNLNVQFDTTGEVENAVYLLDNGFSISNERKKELLEKQNGAIQSRLDSIINQLQNQDLKLNLIIQQSLYLQLLQIIAYNKNIQPNLNIKKHPSSWDLSI